MTLKIKRTKSKEVEATTDEDFGLVIICQQTTKKEHKEIKRDLENSLDFITSADIFYVWGNASIFIFDIDNFTEKDKHSIDSVLPKIKHAVIFNGKKEKGNTVNEMYITSDTNTITVGKKFCTLFRFSKRR